MRSIEHKLDILTSTMDGSGPDKEAQQTTEYTYPYNTVVNRWNRKSIMDCVVGTGKTQRVDLVWDVYMKDSPKLSTRTNRGTGSV